MIAAECETSRRMSECLYSNDDKNKLQENHSVIVQTKDDSIGHIEHGEDSFDAIEKSYQAIFDEISRIKCRLRSTTSLDFDTYDIDVDDTMEEYLQHAVQQTTTHFNETIRKSKDVAIVVPFSTKTNTTTEKQQLSGTKEENELTTVSLDLNKQNPFFSFLERTKMHMRNSEAAQAKLRDAVREKEMQSLKKTPTINKKSMGLQRSVDDFLVWKMVKETKLQYLRYKQQQLEQSQFTGIPVLTKKSHQIVEKMRNLKDCLKIEDRLTKCGKEYQHNLLSAVNKEQEKYPFHPQIAPHSANVPRHGDIADRLYQLAIKKRQDTDTKIASSYDILSIDKTLQVPKRSGRSRTRCSSSQTVVSRLTAKGEEYRSRRIKRALEQKEKQKRIQESSKMNYRSQMLSQCSKESSKERLLRPIGLVRDSTLLHLFENHPLANLIDSRMGCRSRSYSPSRESHRISLNSNNFNNFNNSKNFKNFNNFKNSNNFNISKNSKSSKNSKNSSPELYNSNNSSPKPNTLNLNDEKPVNDEKPILQNYTFQSKGNEEEKSKFLTNKFYSRQVAWQVNRDAKCQSQREELLDSEMQECTFNPSILSTSGDKKKVASIAWSHNFYKLNMEKIKRKNELLAREKQNKQIMEMNECTFKPAILSSSSTTCSITNYHVRKQQIDNQRNVKQRFNGHKNQAEQDLKDQAEQDLKDQAEQDLKNQAEQDLKNQAEQDLKNQAEQKNDKMPPKNDKKPTKNEEMIVHASNHSNESFSDSRMQNEKLPLGWKQFCTDDGYLYYYNEITKITQWETPVSP